MDRPFSRVPDTLYDRSVSSVTKLYPMYKNDIKIFQNCVVFDIYYKLFRDGMIEPFIEALENLNVLHKLLKAGDKIFLLHHSFQSLIDRGYKMAFRLADGYRDKCVGTADSEQIYKIINLGFLLGSFLTDAGWFPESELVFTSCLNLCRQNNAVMHTNVILDCYKRILYTQNGDCNFKGAEATIKDVKPFIDRISNVQMDRNSCSIFGEIASFHFLRNNYKEAYDWSVAAIKALNSNVPHRDVVRILCIGSKSCAATKQLRRAEFLIKQAVQRATKIFGEESLFYAEALVDYGLFLFRCNCTTHAIRVYNKVLKIYTEILGSQNLLVATVYEELAAALYARDYGTGRFNMANFYIDRALKIKENLLPKNHLLMVSVYSIEALIMEERAIDIRDEEFKKMCFPEIEKLYTSALEIVRQHLGESNVEIARIYDNLGRLYQFMGKIKESEAKHLEALSLKTEILGPDDYEVAVSMGHLASVYHYDLGLNDKALKLYERAIEIYSKEFGEGYSGLEIEYRGLLSVYFVLEDEYNISKVQSHLNKWMMLNNRIEENNRNLSPFDINVEMVPPEEMYLEFLKLENV